MCAQRGSVRQCRNGGDQLVTAVGGHQLPVCVGTHGDGAAGEDDVDAIFGSWCSVYLLGVTTFSWINALGGIAACGGAVLCLLSVWVAAGLTAVLLVEVLALVLVAVLAGLVDEVVGFAAGFVAGFAAGVGAGACATRIIGFLHRRAQLVYGHGVHIALCCSA